MDSDDDQTPHSSPPSLKQNSSLHQGSQINASIVDDIIGRVDQNKRLCVLWRVRYLPSTVANNVERRLREVELVPTNNSFTIYSRPMACPFNDRVIQVAAQIATHRTGIEVTQVYVVQTLPQMMQCTGTCTHVHGGEIHPQAYSILINCQFQDTTDYSYWTINHM